MVAGKPEKPWKNIAPRPDLDRLLSLDKGNMGSVEKTGPGVEYLFDADREFISKTEQKNNFSGLLEELKGKDKETAKDLLSGFGIELMKKVAEVGEANKDRAWEMIEICAKQTGLSFPHVLQIYAELFTLCSRPVDKWAVAESHPNKMRVQQFTCSYLKAQQDAGVDIDGLPCQGLCLSAFEYAAELRNIPVNVSLTKQLPKDNMCEFTFIPQ